MANVKIVIGQRGWVWVGEASRDGCDIVLSRASCVRRWGTTKGLGELAHEGPRPETRLDPVGTVRVHELAAVGVIDCNAEAWAGALGR